MRTIAAIMILFTVALTTDAKPDKPAPKAEQKKAMPPVIVSGLTNWGTLTQSGTSIKLEGHPVWDAIGNVRPDGRVYILWTLKATSEPCPGVYNVNKDGSLDGLWGYGGRCQVDEKGDLVGDTHSDRIYSVVPEVPGF